MAENIDDLTIAFYQDDRNVLKEIRKKVLTRGNWTTIMYLFQELNKKTNEYEAPKISVRRYQKRGGRVSPKPAKMSKCNKQSSFTGSKRFFGASD
jgi:hypothetical protein